MQRPYRVTDASIMLLRVKQVSAWQSIGVDFSTTTNIRNSRKPLLQPTFNAHHQRALKQARLCTAWREPFKKWSAKSQNLLTLEECSLKHKLATRLNHNLAAQTQLWFSHNCNKGSGFRSVRMRLPRFWCESRMRLLIKSFTDNQIRSGK
jgi:hypothetical protein